MKEIKHILLRHVENNIIKYVVTLLLFIVGVVLGILFATNNNELFGDMYQQIESACKGLSTSEFDNYRILKTSFLKNIRNSFLIMTGGFSVWLLPVLAFVLLTCGFSYGFTVAYLSLSFGTAGFLLGFTSVVLNLLVIVPVSIVMSVVAINNASILKHKKSDGKNLTGYVLCCLLLFLCILPVCIADGFVIPEILKLICVNITY